MSDLYETSTANGRTIMAALPPLRGRLTPGAPLWRLSWFRTGGPVDLLFEPADEKDLCSLLQALPADVPITVIGVGSNLLVRDGGVRGVVIRLGRQFADIEARGDLVKAGSGAMDVHVAKAAAKAGIGGAEFLIGVPGTIGGAVFMNAGAYGREIKDVLLQMRAVDRMGVVRDIKPESYPFDYRHSGLPSDWIITQAILKGYAAPTDEINEKMNTITSTRADSQPLGTRTGGSTFKNPDPDLSDGRSAWQLVDEAGCRGLRIGDAGISEKHCNFMINHGSATAAQIEELGTVVQDRVKAATGVSLAWEIKIIGEKGA